MINMNGKKIICWWSGGITSAVACKLAIDMFGSNNECRVIMIDTQNEDDDTYRFLKDCEAWYGIKIEMITAIDNGLPDREFIPIGRDYESIQDVWRKNKSLNVAMGAVCSSRLKQRVRDNWQKKNEFDHQVFGFEFERKEFNRAMSIKKSHPKAKGIFPLIMMGLDKEDCIQIVTDAGITIPRTYRLGFRNNNCFKTGCVQGGIGYWQKMKVDFPDKFNTMADMEHELTELKGEPVTMLKDQGGEAKGVVKETGLHWKQFIFLKKNPKYPELKCIDDIRPREVEPLVDCNGFCGTNDINPRIATELEINFDATDDELF